MSNSVICRGGRASTLAPLLPRFVTTKAAFESFESDFRTNVGSAFTLSARIAEEISSPWRKPRAAMMCTATVNWTLFTDMISPVQCVMLIVTIGCIFVYFQVAAFRFLNNPQNELNEPRAAT